eukprot:TRINITY_DN18600_c0_g1_i1.p3 TRINITY_DN18600_c0_g1~~TRINITY_DN18600_c0_g1_i1.p3  ORF type:complete len:114 (+),score=36.69 TRINITY_DN18600_c0_g1_i1:43-384(+)
MSGSFVVRAEAEPVEQAPGLTRRMGAHTPELMLCEYECKKGAVVPLHKHPNVQAGYVVSGSVQIVVGEEGHTELKVCGKGDSYALPGNVPHMATMLADSLIVETFSPARTEWL